MTKQATANEIFSANRNASRSWIVDQIKRQTACSDVYAGTLYRKAKKVSAEKLANARFALVEGNRVYVGDYVCFKSDIEQCGKVTAINGQDLSLENENGFSGDYLRYATTTVERASDCWVE